MSVWLILLLGLGCDFNHNLEKRLMREDGTWAVTWYSYTRSDQATGQVLATWEGADAGSLTFFQEEEPDTWWDKFILRSLPSEVDWDGAIVFLPCTEFLYFEQEDLGNVMNWADHADYNEREVVEMVDKWGDEMAWESEEVPYRPDEAPSIIHRTYEVRRGE